VFAQQWRGQRAQITVAEPVRQQPEGQKRAEQGMDAGVGEAQPGDACAVIGDDRIVDGAEDFRAAGGVVAGSLDAEQAPVGGEADLPRCGQIGQPFPISTSRVSLMVVSVRSALFSLWYCLIVVCL
jgi:hypothetical protein